ncbi:MAG: hypothetical protein ACI4SV_03635, partial [Duodenibacillus sp.]
LLLACPTAGAVETQNVTGAAAEPAVAPLTAETAAAPAAPTDAAVPATEATGVAAEAALPAIEEGEPDDNALRIAFLLPAADSPFDKAAHLALQGLLASNYASTTPARILLIRPGSDGSVFSQLDEAVRQGAMAAVGPIDRNRVEDLAALDYLPLPVVTLNQVDLDTAVALTSEEIEAEKARLIEERRAAEAAKEAEQQAAASGETPTDAAAAAEPATQPAQAAVALAVHPTAATAEPTKPLVGEAQDGERISAKTAVPGLVTADETAVVRYRFEPRQFPRNLLMLGLSMEDDAAFLARLGVAALPEDTESGERPKVLLLDTANPLDQRISQAFEHELVLAGFAPDRMTIDTHEITRVNQFFKIVIDKSSDADFNEVPIDQEADPIGWRQQQIRLRRLEAAKRARAALSEPPYHAAFLAMDAKTASLVRSRLPIRTRVWGTPIVNPGNTRTNPQAKAMTYDLMHVALVEAPSILSYNAEEFESKFQVPAPAGTLQLRLFSLGADALALARSVAQGTESSAIEGMLGSLRYNLAVSPKAERRGRTAMIFGGEVRPMDEDAVVAYQELDQGARPLRRLRAQSRSLERLEKEAQEAAREAGTLAEPEGSAEPAQGAQAAPETVPLQPAAQTTPAPLPAP